MLLNCATKKPPFPTPPTIASRHCASCSRGPVRPSTATQQKNPARDVGKLRSKNPDGIRAWSEADAARYEARHPIGTKARLAFDLLLYTGVRRSDVVRLGPQMLVYGNIARRQHGRGAKARLHRDEGQLADRQNARTADPAAAATKHRRHADRTFGLSGDGA